MKRILVECLWLGCKAKFNPFKEFNTFPNVIRGWLVHSIRCPKCRNIVGHFAIEPSMWISFSPRKGKSDLKRYMIHNTRTKKPIYLKGGASLNRYLKPLGRTAKKR